MKLKDSMPMDVYLRIYRSWSWLKAADDNPSTDAKFIFLWITFNTAYAQEFKSGGELMKPDSFKIFRVPFFDSTAMIGHYNTVWKNYSGKIRPFIDNKYVTRYFCDFHNGQLTEDEWIKKFDKSRAMVQKALVIKDTVVFVGIPYVVGMCLKSLKTGVLEGVKKNTSIP